VTIEWWTVSSEEYTEEAQRAMAQEFEASHPNIKVNVTVLPSSGFGEKMTTALGAGEGAPDVAFFWDNNWFPEALELTPYIEADPDFSPDLYYPGFWNTRAKWGDKVVGQVPAGDQQVTTISMHGLVQCLTVYRPAQAYLVLLVLIGLDAQQLADGGRFQDPCCLALNRLDSAQTRLPDLGFYYPQILTQCLQLLGPRLPPGSAHRSAEYHQAAMSDLTLAALRLEGHLAQQAKVPSRLVIVS
jgi:hypothetical protein